MVDWGREGIPTCVSYGKPLLLVHPNVWLVHQVFLGHIPLNHHGYVTNFNYIVRSMVNLMLAIDQSWSFLSLGCIFLHVISCSLPSLPSLGWFQGKSETLPIFDGQNSLVSGDYPVHPEYSIRHSSPDNGWVNDGQWMGSWLGKPSING